MEGYLVIQNTRQNHFRNPGAKFKQPEIFFFNLAIKFKLQNLTAKANLSVPRAPFCLDLALRARSYFLRVDSSLVFVI